MNFLTIEDTEIVFFISIGFVLVVILALTIAGNIKKKKYKYQDSIKNNTLDENNNSNSESKTDVENNDSNEKETDVKVENDDNVLETIKNEESSNQEKNNTNDNRMVEENSTNDNTTVDDSTPKKKNVIVIKKKQGANISNNDQIINDLITSTNDVISDGISEDAEEEIEKNINDEDDVDVEDDALEATEEKMISSEEPVDYDENVTDLEEINVESDAIVEDDSLLSEEAEDESTNSEDARDIINSKVNDTVVNDTEPVIVADAVDTKTDDQAKKKNATRTYNGKYEVFQEAGGYRYCLKASNGEQLVLSETYTTRDGVMKAIANVKKNIETGNIKIFADKKGKFKFKLISKNFRVLVVSSSYTAEKSANRAAQSFKKFALKADIIDVEEKDNDIKTATDINITVTEDKQGGKFEIEKYDGEFSWDLKASNGQILCQADGYTTKAGCLYSIETFKKNITSGKFKCAKDKNNRYFYKLYTNQNRVCAIGESYDSKQAVESAANSVVSFYKNAEIVEIK